MKPDFTDIKQIIDQHLPSASSDEAKAAGARVRHRLQTPGDRARELEARLDHAQPAGAVASAFLTTVASAEVVRRKVATRWMPLAAAAVLVMGVIGTAILWHPAEDPLFRVVEGDVYRGDTIRSNGGGGAVLALADGSRIEMRSHSELSLEQARDGVRIRLTSGGIIVNAATQRTGHLYVQTKDMTVSVVGTVFVVNADDDGSRVAVIEGEVRVQHGATETKLRSGEQVASSPKAETFSVASELAWSRRAESWLALLQRQSAAEQRPADVVTQTPKEPRVAFEVVSIRPSAPAPIPPAGARGGGGGGANSRPSKDGCVFDSFGYSYQLDPRRLAVNRTTVLHLLAFTIPNPFQGPEQYRPDLNCITLTKLGLLTGGPDWIRNDAWDVVATIPEGRFTATPNLTDPVAQQMLRTMLEERFHLVIRRETREMPVYLLKVGKDGPKFNGRYRDPSGRDVLDAVGIAGSEGCRASMNRDNSNSRYFIFKVCSTSMASLAADLGASLQRPVLDQTGLAGRFAYFYGFYDPGTVPQIASIGEGPEPRPRQEKAIEEIGLRVEESRAPVDVWVIERVERPEPQNGFDVATIRRSADPLGGGRGDAGGRGSSDGPCDGPVVPLRVDVDPSRFAVYRATLRSLLMAAYGTECRLLSGGPDWVRSERYDIEAAIPAGAATNTAQQFRNGDAPQLQSMLRTLLASRFKVALRTENRPTSVYRMLVVKEGLMKPASSSPSSAGVLSRPVPSLGGRMTTRQLASMLTSFVNRPVVDQTNLAGSFDVRLEWGFELPAPGTEAGPRRADNRTILPAIQEQLGLKLEPALVPMQFLVIESAQRPSEN